MRLRLVKYCFLVGLLSAVVLPLGYVKAQALLDQKELEASYKLARACFLKSLNMYGLFDYAYEPVLNQFPKGNNPIRQLMASRLLAELSREDSSLIPEHQRNLDFVLTKLVLEKDDLSLVYMQNSSKLGANAMLLRTLVVSPLYEKYKEQTQRVKRAVLRSINKDGSMNPYLVEPPYAYQWDYLLTFYSGEALVGLIELYEKTREPELLAVIKKSQDFYINKYVNQLEKNYYPAYVPWHSIALNKLFKITNEKKYAQAAFIMSDKLLEMQDRTSGADIGRFYNPATPEYGSPHASSQGVYVEGLVYALELAKLLKEEARIKSYREAVELGFKNLISLQYNAENSGHLAAPERAIGGFRIVRAEVDVPFTRDSGAEIRIDSIQHTMDGMRKYLGYSDLLLKAK
jgi:hypothetical protein